MNYEEKLRLAEEALASGSYDKETIEYIFPELKESKGERIRKEIIQFLQLPHPQFVGKRNHEEWIAWLEKQVEQKPVWSEGDKKMINLLIKIFEVNHPNGHFKVKVNPIGITNMEDISTKEIVDWLKSIKPQKRWKPTEQNIEDLEWCADLVQDKMGVGFHRLQVFIDELKQL